MRHDKIGDDCDSRHIARLRFVLIVTVVLSSLSLMSCKTQQTVETRMVETHCRASLQQYDSTCYLDRTFVRDTVAALRTETIWREPDSIGNIYPLMTVNTETSARRQTQNNITSTHIDTFYITDNTDDVATETSTSCRDARSWEATVPRSSAAGLSTVLLTTFANNIDNRRKNRG